MLEVAADPQLIERWFPLPLRLDGHGDMPLQAGGMYRAKGRLAGRDLNASVHVEQADERRVRMIARGPLIVELDVRLSSQGPGRCVIDATVSCRSGGGIAGRVFETAAAPLLAPETKRALDSIAWFARDRARD